MKPGGTVSLAVCVQARPKDGPDANTAIDVAAEHAARHALTEAAWHGPGRLETPEPLLDHAFALQKLHVLECPIETIKGVIVHNGSLRYSPGIWANDPVEYSSPLFPFFGDPELNRASMGMYRVWQDYCRQNGIVPCPGSFEGPALELTQRERGDDAMVLYGLSKFLLFQGDRAAAAQMWPLIEMIAASMLKHKETLQPSRPARESRTASSTIRIGRSFSSWAGRPPSQTAGSSTPSIPADAQTWIRRAGGTMSPRESSGRMTGFPMRRGKSR